MQISPPPLIGEARIAELVHAYLDAEYRWELDGRWLSLNIGQAAPDVWEHLSSAHSAGLVSAWDPYSVQRPEAVNRAADQRLHRELLEGGLRCRAAFSSAVNRTWREPSWLVADMPPEAFDGLSRRYGQLGTLYWTRDMPVRMRIDAVRPVGFVGDRHIDWLK
jgi:hypothetical protein